LKLHREDDYTKRAAKDLLHAHLRQNYHMAYGIWGIPGVTGIGIDEHGLVVTTHNHADYVGRFIPAVLEGIEISVENLGRPERIPIPPFVDETGGFYDMKRRGDGKTVQSGVIISGRESGSCFSALQDRQGKHYAVCSSHVLDNSQNVRVFSNTVGHVTQDARHCNASTHVDAAAALLNQNVPVSGTMIGLNVAPTGFAKAQVGMTIHTSGSNSGTTTQKITMINYDLQNDTGGNCSTHFQDCWVGSVRSKPGDSGSGMINDQHQLVGILTTNVSKGSMNCSAVYIQSEMGLNVLSNRQQ
jgi:Trypsin